VPTPSTVARFIAISGIPFCLLATSVHAQSTGLTAGGFSQHWGTSNAEYDLNGDGIVNAADLSLFLQTSSSEGSGLNVGSNSAGGTELLGGTETPGAASPLAAGPDAPIFYKNAAGDVTAAKIAVGSAFAGASIAPAQVGLATETGNSARAIARWDFIPYRTVTSPTNIGVVAFHIGGIERVSFSANGGPWTDVYEMKRNPQTGVWEYFITLDPAEVGDGLVEIRAIAYPKNGKPRILQGPREGNERLGEHSMWVWTNASGSLPASERWVSATGSDLNDGLSAATPMRTVAKAAASIQAAQGNAGGGIINVLPGNYSWTGSGTDEFGASVPNPVTQTRWLTVRRAPGTIGDVTFTSGTSDGALATKLLAIEGLRFLQCNPSRAGSTPNGLIWIGNCDLQGSSTSDAVQFVDAGFVGGYLTQTRISNCVTGVNRAFLIRDVHIANIGKDAITSVPMILNSTARGIMRPAGQTWHCDVLQYSQSAQPRSNMIVYGLKAFDNRSQGLIARDGAATTPVVWSDIAFVNFFDEFAQGSTHTAQWRISTDHMLIWNCSFVGGPLLIRGYESDGMELNYSNISIRGCVFTKLTVGSNVIPAVTAVNNHFITTPVFGSGATLGDPLYRDPLANDYRPGPGSPLLDRLDEIVAPVDSDLKVVAEPANVGSFVD
jgi:hypothetical protein